MATYFGSFGDRTVLSIVDSGRIDERTIINEEPVFRVSILFESSRVDSEQSESIRRLQYDQRSKCNLS
jgi:hypothetical protein